MKIDKLEKDYLGETQRDSEMEEGHRNAPPPQAKR